MVADRHPLKGVGERVDQRLVLVDLRTRSLTQSCMPRVCVRCTAAGAPCLQKLLHPQKTPSRGHKLDAGTTLDESTGLALKMAVAPSPDWLLCRVFAKPLVSFSPFGPSMPRGGVVSGSCSRDARYMSYRTRFTSFPNLYWALLELVVSASCAGSTSAIDCPEVSCSPGQKALSRQLSGTMFLMASSETPWTSRRSPNAADEIRVGKSPPGFLPYNW